MKCGDYDSGHVQALDYFGDGTRSLIVVSPFTKPENISHRYTDHVSILKFLEYNWELPTISKRLPNPKHELGSVRSGKQPGNWRFEGLVPIPGNALTPVVVRRRHVNRRRGGCEGRLFCAGEQPQREGKQISECAARMLECAHFTLR